MEDTVKLRRTAVVGGLTLALTAGVAGPAFAQSPDDSSSSGSSGSSSPAPSPSTPNFQQDFERVFPPGNIVEEILRQLPGLIQQFLISGNEGGRTVVGGFENLPAAFCPILEQITGQDLNCQVPTG